MRLKPWHVKCVRLGGVYHPRGNNEYIYALLRPHDDRAIREAGFWIAAALWDGHTRNFLPVDFERIA